jgi:hypothetical protein
MGINCRIGLCRAFVLLWALSCSGQDNSDKEEELVSRAARPEKKTVIQDLCWSPDNRYIYFSAMKVNPDFSDYSPQLWCVYRFDIDAKSPKHFG